ncbi:MAG: 2'-5' RNA ligase family protein [Bacteroidota bacterium]
MSGSLRVLEPHERLRARYDAIWADARPVVAAGRARINPYLRDEVEDTRRGLTLAARIAPGPRSALMNTLAELADGEPGVYLYPESSLHVTVQSLVQVQEEAHPLLALRDDFLDAIRPILRRSPPFGLVCWGLTGSRDAVLLQGYPTDEGLDHLRASLQAALKRAGLAQALDDRFAIAIAHATVARYRAPLRNPAGFAARLDAHRLTGFGTMSVTEVEVVETDWFMTPGLAQVCKRFRLDVSTSGGSV